MRHCCHSNKNSVLSSWNPYKIIFLAFTFIRMNIKSKPISLFQTIFTQKKSIRRISCDWTREKEGENKSVLDEEGYRTKNLWKVPRKKGQILKEETEKMLKSSRSVIWNRNSGILQEKQYQNELKLNYIVTEYCFLLCGCVFDCECVYRSMYACAHVVKSIIWSFNIEGSEWEMILESTKCYPKKLSFANSPNEFGLKWIVDFWPCSTV